MAASPLPSARENLLFIPPTPALRAAAYGGRPRPAAGTLATTMPQLRTDSLYRELAERLGPVMPAHVTISHDSRFPSLTLAGHSGNSGRLFPTLFIRGPFCFRLRLSAELILRDVQRFAVIELHRPCQGNPAGGA